MFEMTHSVAMKQERLNAWAVMLAGGEGTRLQSLTRRVAGDSRPKQFCRLYGGRSLLGHTRERLRPVFRDDRTMFVVSKAHETFYREELFDVHASRVVAQPSNRGTGVAIIAALLRILQQDADATVAFFPSDHFFADEAAFTAGAQLVVVAAREHAESLILLGAEPRWPEVEFGWIEPGARVKNGDQTSLLRVRRFWEKPSPAGVRELMRKGGLWNTFVIAGRAGAFLKLLRSTVPSAVDGMADAFARGGLDAAYRDVNTIDFSKDVLSLEPDRLLVMRDSTSGWADLGSPDRLIETLIENRIETEWLREIRGSEVSTVNGSPPAPPLHAVGHAGALNSVRSGRS